MRFYARPGMVGFLLPAAVNGIIVSQFRRVAQIKGDRKNRIVFVACWACWPACCLPEPQLLYFAVYRRLSQ